MYCLRNGRSNVNYSYYRTKALCVRFSYQEIAQYSIDHVSSNWRSLLSLMVGLFLTKNARLWYTSTKLGIREKGARDGRSLKRQANSLLEHINIRVTNSIVKTAKVRASILLFIVVDVRVLCTKCQSCSCLIVQYHKSSLIGAE